MYPSGYKQDTSRYIRIRILITDPRPPPNSITNPPYRVTHMKSAIPESASVGLQHVTAHAAGVHTYSGDAMLFIQIFYLLVHDSILVIVRGYMEIRLSRCRVPVANKLRT
jgi:hypothetical protein